MKNKIRLGMVGGGKDAFIGAVHRMAARMDEKYDFVAGCLSSTAEKSKIIGYFSTNNNSQILII